MAAPVVVRARGQRGLAAARQELGDGRGADAGLVAQHQDQHLAARIDRGPGGGDRRRAALAEVVVLDDLDAGEIDSCLDLVRATADDAYQLVERARPGGAQYVLEQRRRTVWQQLLGLPKAFRAACGEHQAGGELAAHGSTSRVCSREFTEVVTSMAGNDDDPCRPAGSSARGGPAPGLRAATQTERFRQRGERVVGPPGARAA